MGSPISKALAVGQVGHRIRALNVVCPQWNQLKHHAHPVNLFGSEKGYQGKNPSAQGEADPIPQYSLGMEHSAQHCENIQDVTYVELELHLKHAQHNC